MTVNDRGIVLVRSLKTADLDRVVELMSAHAAFERATFDSTHKAARLARLLVSPGHGGRCFVATIDDQIVGSATVSLEFSTWAASHYLHMDTLFVDEAHRGAGIGAALFETVRRRARDLGVDQIQWQTPDWNEAAIRFYRRLGARSATKVRFTLDIQATTHETAGNPLAAFSAAWQARNLVGLAATLHPDCWYSPSVGSSLGETHYGRPAVLAAVQNMWAHDEGSTAVVGPAMVAGPHTVVRRWEYVFPDQPSELGIDVFTLEANVILGKDA